MIALRNAAIAVALAIGIVLVGALAYSWGKRSQAQRIDALVSDLSESDRTVKVKDGLYATALAEVSDAKRLLQLRESEHADMLKQLDAAKARVLTTERVVVKWRTLASPVEVTQGTAPADPSSPEIPRKRVDFRHDFGPFLVMGYTLTDPPAGFVTVEQGRPLALTIAVSKDGNGKWVSRVASSDPNVDVSVSLGAVDPGVLSPRWHQRLWVTGGVGLLGGTSIGLGVQYQGERFSLGPQCQVWSGGRACGASFGVRLFR